MNELFGTEVFFDSHDFARLAVRLAVNLVFATWVIWFVYFRVYKNREFVFTYYVFNFLTFAICALLRNVPMELGFALGLFGLFGVLRYRTEEIRSRDLTYLFIVIGLGLINAVPARRVTAAELLAVDVAIGFLCGVLELPSTSRRHGATPMIYDNIALLKPGQQEALFADLRERIGMEVVRVDVDTIDFLRDAAEITVVYLRPEV
ncbi:MAG TPA: DUF4956 domain-containing protein [Kofleriaceae bacterium]|nr:DUF4956 domain-containing protein [Kofleriaceae bacterium]